MKKENLFTPPNLNHGKKENYEINDLTLAAPNQYEGTKYFPRKRSNVGKHQNTKAS